MSGLKGVGGSDGAVVSNSWLLGNDAITLNGYDWIALGMMAIALTIFRWWSHSLRDDERERREALRSRPQRHMQTRTPQQATRRSHGISEVSHEDVVFQRLEDGQYHQNNDSYYNNGKRYSSPQGGGRGGGYQSTSSRNQQHRQRANSDSENDD